MAAPEAFAESSGFDAAAGAGFARLTGFVVGEVAGTLRDVAAQFSVEPPVTGIVFGAALERSAGIGAEAADQLFADPSEAEGFPVRMGCTIARPARAFFFS